MAAWWASLTSAEHVFYGIAFGATAFLIVQLVLNLIGLAGHDADVGGGLEAQDLPGDAMLEHPDLEAHSTGLGFISVRTVIAFFVGLGWGGVAALEMGAPIPVAVIVAGLVGLVFLLTVFYLMRTIFRLSETGNVDYRNAAGRTGSVYVTIPAAGQGRGQVQIVVQGRLREVAAMTDGAEALAPGTPVQVAKVLDDLTLVVHRIEVKP